MYHTAFSCSCWRGLDKWSGIQRNSSPLPTVWEEKNNSFAVLQNCWQLDNSDRWIIHWYGTNAFWPRFPAREESKRQHVPKRFWINLWIFVKIKEPVMAKDEWKQKNLYDLIQYVSVGERTTGFSNEAQRDHTDLPHFACKLLLVVM